MRVNPKGCLCAAVDKSLAEVVGISACRLVMQDVVRGLMHIT